jgi:DNA gyrase/topoisomerase IV subunit A
MKSLTIKLNLIGVDGKLFDKFVNKHKSFEKYKDPVTGEIYGFERIDEGKRKYEVVTKSVYKEALQKPKEVEGSDQKDKNSEREQYEYKAAEPSPDKGYVYIMVNASIRGMIKVGFTERDVEQRRKELSSVPGVATPFKIYKVFPVPKGAGAEAEKIAHKALLHYRQKKEFFRCSAAEADELIEAKLTKLMEEPAFDIKATYKSIKEAKQEFNKLCDQKEKLNNWVDEKKNEAIKLFHNKKSQSVADLTKPYLPRLKGNKIAATITVIIICSIAWSFSKQALHYVLCFGVFWIPILVTSVFRIYAEDLPEFKNAFDKEKSALEKERDFHLSSIEADYNQKKKILDEKIKKVKADKYTGKEKLRSLGIH